MLTDEREREIRFRIKERYLAPDKVELRAMVHDLLDEIDRLRVELGDAEDMISALRNDWVVENQHFYDEECVEGWVWIDPQGKEHSELGDHGATPIWPESARAALGRR